MILDIEAIEYLRGKSFSNGWTFPILSQSRIVQRNTRLVELSRGKSVLHVGCADHVELIEKKIREGRYLHALLHNVASKLTGVDISEEGIDAMRSIGFRDVWLPSQLPAYHYDLMIVSDVIEHVPNVQMFLISLHQYDFETIIVTTPNAYRRINRRQYRGEFINTDHRYWFSPFTLCKVLFDAGFQLEALEFTDIPSRLNFVRNLFLKKFPLLQDGLLAIARKQNRTDI